MRFFTRLFLILSFFSASYAQNLTGLTGTLTDHDGQVWANATWTARIVIPGGGSAHYLSGGTVPTTFSGQLAPNGAISGNVGNGAQIVPFNTQWQFTVCSITSAPCVSYKPVYVSGSTFAIGTFLSTNSIAPLMEARFGNYAYNTTEILNPVQGTGYTNTITNIIYLFDGVTYVPVTSSSGGSSIQTPYASYLAFGDSQTAAYSSTGGYSTSYPKWVSRTIGIVAGTDFNYGYPGFTSNQEDEIVYPTSYIYAPTTLITYMIGTNNVQVNGGDTNLAADYGLNIQAQLAWWVTPVANKIPFATGAVTFSPTNSWAAGTNAIGRYTLTTNSTATFNITGNTLLIATTAYNANTSTASVKCDGNTVSMTLHFTGLGGVALLQAQSMLSVGTLTGTGSHTCVLTAVPGSSTDFSKAVAIEWVGGINSTTNYSKSPLVLVESLPDNQTPNANNALYNTQQTTAVSTLNQLGFTNLYTVNNTGAVTSTNYYNDNLHFDNYGYYQLAQPTITKINTILGSTYHYALPFDYFYGNVVDWCASGQNNQCMGYGAGISLTSGTRDSFNGIFSGHNALDAGDNDTSGFSSGGAIVHGQGNTVHGSNAYANGDGSFNTIIGDGAAFRDLGSESVIEGYGADGNSTGSHIGKTIVGTLACQNGDIDFLFCMGIGAGNPSGTTNPTNTSDVLLSFIGSETGKAGSMNYTDSTAIGYGALISASNDIQLGDAATLSAHVGVNTTCLSNFTGCVQKQEAPTQTATTASITFDPGYAVSKVLLTTTNVTAFNILAHSTILGSNIGGVHVVLNICEPAAGGITFSGGTGLIGFGNSLGGLVSTAANVCNTQPFVGSFLDGTFYATGPMVANGQIIFPATPPITGNTPVNFTSSRVLTTVYHNTNPYMIYASGNFTVTGGAGDSTITCTIGATSTPSLIVWQNTASFTIIGEPAGFACMVPAGYYYQITGNLHISSTPGSWFETPIK